MLKSKNVEYEKSLLFTTMPEFIEEYNNSIPESFPQASAELLRKFQATHPNYFSDNREKWSISKHRKHIMDWLPSRSIE
jgi:predicted GTPase